ncbi:hypothetical protein ACWCPQ_34225 [Nocardia sp. NPDC001965]
MSARNVTWHQLIAELCQGLSEPEAKAAAVHHAALCARLGHRLDDVVPEATATWVRSWWKQPGTIEEALMAKVQRLDPPPEVTVAYLRAVEGYDGGRFEAFHTDGSHTTDLHGAYPEE